MPTSFNSGNCNENPLDYNCFCIGGGPSRFYKIYDTASGEYICCGTVGLQSTSNYPNLLGTNDPVDNSIYNAALEDDPRCMGWWNGSDAVNRFSNIQPTPPTIPVAGKDWYLPDAETLSNGLMPPSWGPSFEDLETLQLQTYINEVITIPEYSIEGGRSKATCTNSELYWMRALNPNNRSSNYIETLVCANLDTVRNSTASQQSNFALFNVNCVKLFGDNVCELPVGQISNVGTSVVGNLVYNTANYGGSTLPQPQPAQGPTPWWAEAWFWVLIILAVIIVALIIVFVLYHKSKKEYESKSF